MHSTAQQNLGLSTHILNYKNPDFNNAFIKDSGNDRIGTL